MRCRNSLWLHAFTVLMLAANASASDHDLQQWTSLRLEHEFFDGLTAGVRARVRFDDDVSRDKDLTVGPSVRWEPLDRLTFTLGYDYLYDLQDESTAAHRGWQAVGFTFPFRGLTIGNRIRFDERFIEGVSGAVARLRYRLRTTYDTGGLRLDGFHLSASEEVFVNVNDQGEGPVDGFEQNRVRAGAGWQLGKARVEAGYEWQYGRRRSAPWLHRHVLFVEFTFSPNTFETE